MTIARLLRVILTDRKIDGQIYTTFLRPKFPSSRFDTKTVECPYVSRRFAGRC